MKVYKNGEAITMLEENSSLKFKCTTEERTYTLYSDGNKILVISDRGIDSGLNIRDKWILIQQSVDFIEALKAIDEGKTIYCKYTNNYVNKGDVLIIHTYKPKCNGLLQDEQGKSPTLWMMLNIEIYVSKNPLPLGLGVSEVEFQDKSKKN